MTTTQADVRQAVAAYSRWFSNMRTDELVGFDRASQAAAEEAASTPERTQLLTVARVGAAVRLVSARSILDGAALCFNLEDPLASVHTLSRAVIEQTAIARWLVDPAITADERVGRAAADELHGLHQKRKLGLGDATLWANVEVEIQQARARIHAASIELRKRPTATELVGLTLGEKPEHGEMLYRLYSAHPHAASYFVTSGLAQLEDTVDPLRLAVVSSLHGFDAFTRYIGWGGRATWRQWAGRMVRERLGVSSDAALEPD